MLKNTFAVEWSQKLNAMRVIGLDDVVRRGRDAWGANSQLGNDFVIVYIGSESNCYGIAHASQATLKKRAETLDKKPD